MKGIKLFTIVCRRLQLTSISFHLYYILAPQGAGIKARSQHFPPTKQNQIGKELRVYWDVSATECRTRVYWSAADGCWCFANQLQMSTQPASRGACENPQLGRIGIKRAFIYRRGRAQRARVCLMAVSGKIMHPVTRGTYRLWWRTGERHFLAQHTCMPELAAHTHERRASSRIIWW